MAFCTSCGLECEPTDRFCGNCGAARDSTGGGAKSVDHSIDDSFEVEPTEAGEKYRFWLPRSGKGQAIFLFLVGFMTSYIAAGFRDEGGIVLVVFAAAISWFGLSVWRFVFTQIYKVF